MKITSEQEMIKFGESFTSAGDADRRDSNNAFRDISRPTGSELARSPVTTAPWDADDLWSTGATKRVEKGVIESRHAAVIELIGDVGAGKTTFVRGLAKGLGIEEPITSPSFTISKFYALPGGGNLVHYDFYRLTDPGLMSEDLYENINNPKNIVIVEWGESVKEILPKNHIIIEIHYNDDNTREVKIK